MTRSRSQLASHASSTSRPAIASIASTALGAQLAAVEQGRDELAEDGLRASYTEDGVFVAAGDVHDLDHGAGSALGEVADRGCSLDGAEFERRALIHAGDIREERRWVWLPVHVE